MAHFYGSMKGSRSEKTSAAGKDAGIKCHVRGWNIGVKAQVMHYKHTNSSNDGASATFTDGSNGNNSLNFTVSITSDGEAVLSYKNTKGNWTTKKVKFAKVGT